MYIRFLYEATASSISDSAKKGQTNNLCFFQIYFFQKKVGKQISKLFSVCLSKSMAAVASVVSDGFIEVVAWVVVAQFQLWLKPFAFERATMPLVGGPHDRAKGRACAPRGSDEHSGAAPRNAAPALGR